MRNVNDTFNQEFMKQGILSCCKDIEKDTNNIIKNCLETSFKQIDIDVFENDSTCHIVVNDHGKGFDEKDLPHLFERFYRGKESQGTGIGLYIAKEIIEAHHGLIHAYNKDGACFEIVIPQFNVKRKI